MTRDFLSLSSLLGTRSSEESDPKMEVHVMLGTARILINVTMSHSDPFLARNDFVPLRTWSLRAVSKFADIVLYRYG